MNASLIVIIASVLFLGGCVQNESRRVHDVTVMKKTATVLPDRVPEKDLRTSPGAETSPVEKNLLPEATHNPAPETNTASTPEEEQTLQQPMVLTGPSASSTLPGQSAGTGAAKTKVDSDETLSLDSLKIREHKAYQEYLRPLFKKISSLHPSTAERFEGQLNKPLTFDQESFDAASTDIQARLLLEAILSGLSQPKNEHAAIVAGQLLKNSERLNLRMLYEYLRYASVDLSDWKIEKLDHIQAQSELIRISLRKMALINAKPVSEFQTQQTTADQSNCQVNITYGGVENGVRIQVAEPLWREFDVKFNPSNDIQTPLLPSMAGSDFQDLEIINPLSDGSKLRFTLRYRIDQKNILSEREPHHLVLEKLPAKGGAAEKILMCRLMDTMLGDLPKEASGQ